MPAMNTLPPLVGLSSSAMKSCAFCAELVQDAALVCKHCGRDLRAGATGTLPNRGIAALLSLVIPGAGQMYKGQVGAGLWWLIAVVIGYIAFIVPGVLLHLVCILNAAGAVEGSSQRFVQTPEQAVAQAQARRWVLRFLVGAVVLAGLLVAALAYLEPWINQHLW